MVFIGFNYLIDPYNIWDSPKINGVNTAKSEWALHERIYKTVGLAQHQADTVILGTSRSDIGLDPSHPAIDQKAINLAISAQSYRETLLLFNLTNDLKSVKNIIIGLDLFPYLPSYFDPIDFTIENYSSNRKWMLVLNGSTLRDSLLTLTKRKVLIGDTWSKNGWRLWSDEQRTNAAGYEHVRNNNGNRQLMSISERGYLTGYYSQNPRVVYQDKTPIENIRAIFARAHRDHIALKLLISPSHARQWETLAAAGLWDKWEEWKRRLVNMNEEEAQRTGQLPFPLWDFSGYHSISTETVPALGDTTTMMRWYFDSSHYTPAAGDLVLDRIFNYHAPDRTVPDDFGVLLTSQNIDTHLARIRTDREHYRLAHPEDVAEIETLAREVAKTKRCASLK